MLGQTRYRAGALVLGTAEEIQAEQDALARGERPTAVLPVELWARDYQEIDVFDWQQTVKDMISTSDLELQLATAEGRIRGAIERQEVAPDHTLQLGERTYHYFRPERAEEIRQRLGLPIVADSTVCEQFREFVERMDMASSYKPVMLMAILDCVDEKGKAPIDNVVAAFHAYYCQRQSSGQIVERASFKMAKAAQLQKDDVRALMLSMPFEKFERRRFLRYDKGDLAFIQFHPTLWRQLTDAELATIRQSCEESIAAYFDQLDARES